MRHFFTLIAVSFAFASLAHADPNQWYGTVHFSKTFTDENTETYPEGHAYYPGTRVYKKQTTWSGTARYIPGGKLIVTAAYRSSSDENRRTERMHACPWKDGPTAYHDFETNTVRTEVSVNRILNNKLTIYIDDDGSYDAYVSVSGGNHVPGATRYYQRREFYNECSEPSLSVNEQSVETSGGMESLSFEHIEGTVTQNAQRLTGSWTGKDSDGGDLTYHWDFTRAEPHLVAIITPVAMIKRGETVTLNGASSTGRITKYEWTFAPEGECLLTSEGSTLKLEGSSVSFKALCDFTAHLEVSNEADGASTNLRVMVTDRKGEDWKTKFQTRAGPNFTSRIFADMIHFGVNQCSMHSSGETTGHMIHTTAENNRTWRDSGYVMTQIQDRGPFNGMWYVESQSLKIDRLERINSELLAGGEVYALNQRKNNLGALQAVTAQVRAHEATHSSLVKDALTMLGSDGDPAVQIEKLVGLDEESFQFLVDFKVREVETTLQEATTDEKVKARLRAKGGMTRDVSLWLPTRPEVSGGSSGEFLKALGPLWNIGH